MYNCITECRTEEGLKLDQCRTEEGFDCPTSRGSASRSSLNRRLQVPEIETKEEAFTRKQEEIDQRGGYRSGDSGGGSKVGVGVIRLWFVREIDERDGEDEQQMVLFTSISTGDWSSGGCTGGGGSSSGGFGGGGSRSSGGATGGRRDRERRREGLIANGGRRNRSGGFVYSRWISRIQLIQAQSGPKSAQPN